jgi:aminopeptidase YwaD
MTLRFSLLTLILSLTACFNSNEKPKAQLTSGGIPQLQKDIRYLASDALEGRDTGTEGEALAAQYIAERYKALGLKPAGANNSYFQPFDFRGSPLIGDNIIKPSGQDALATDTYYPLNFSGSGQAKNQALVDVAYGIIAPELDYNDYDNKEVKGKIVCINVSSPDGIHPHSAYIEYHDLKSRAESAISQGAQAVFFYRDDEQSQAPSETLTEQVETLDAPVLYLKNAPDFTGAYTVNFSIERPKLQGKNVLALLDKGQKSTLVVGAHYDHLGHGISGSLHRGEPDVHNGADDNASGVAAMLQIALDLLDDSIQHNVLFIGFSGEERGLLGSNYFVKNPTIAIDDIAYMLNMDMVGRLDTTKQRISINGVGTSPAWDFIDSTLTVAGISAVTTESGTGPSDHMSFYLSDMPVLHFFSGTHSDYHKPSDDEHLINYPGIMSIVAYMEEVIHRVDALEEIPFTATASERQEAAAFKVTLGIVPDYVYDGKGMRVDGVNQDRPGSRAGLMKGDVIVKMGSRRVGDIYAYMEGLSDYNPGDKTSITVIRKSEEVELDVTFD